MDWELTYRLAVLFLLWRMLVRTKQGVKELCFANRLTAGIDAYEFSAVLSVRTWLLRLNYPFSRWLKQKNAIEARKTIEETAMDELVREWAMAIAIRRRAEELAKSYATQPGDRSSAA